MGSAICYKYKDTGTGEEEPDPDDNYYCPPAVIEFDPYTLPGRGQGKKECQDICIILENFLDEHHFFGIFDGFGINGKHVATYISERIQFNINLNKKDLFKSKTNVEC